MATKPEFLVAKEKVSHIGNRISPNFEPCQEFELQYQKNSLVEEYGKSMKSSWNGHFTIDIDHLAHITAKPE